MADKSLKSLASMMRKLDFCMMTTRDGRGSYHSRPMSNNGEVEYEGDSYFFTWEESTKVKNINEHPMVSLAFQGDDMLFIHVNGEASLIHQRARMEPYWNKELERWFPEGLDTPGVVMIKVSARHIKYWHKEDEGEITL